MTYIDIFEKNGKIKKITIEGHAGSNKHGKDIVCASISVLSQSIINGMIFSLNGRDDFFIIKNKNNNPYIEINLPLHMSDLERIKIETLLDVLKINFKNLKESYKDYINLNFQEVKVND